MSTRLRGPARAYKADPDRLMTADDLLYRNPLPDARTELVEGRLLVRELAHLRHGDVTARLVYAMALHLESDRLSRGAPSPRGLLACNGVGFILRRRPDTVRAPDIAYLLEERLPSDVYCYPEMAPDLAVDVLSHADSAEYMTLKLEHWRTAGCRYAWVVDPQRRSFVAHDNGTVTTFAAGETFDGNALFPGLQLDIGALFD